MTVRIGFDVGSETVKVIILRDDESVEPRDIVLVQGQPMRRVAEALGALIASGLEDDVICGVTGAGAATLKEITGCDAVHEPNAIATAIDKLYPEVRTVIEMGREAQKYLLFERDQASGRLLVEDSNLGNKCASGSGSFLDHMAKRLNYESIAGFAQVALETENPASLSGRCAVFTESDITHLYQKGTPRDRIAAGVHQAISRNYRSAIARGKEFRDKIAFIGGVSENPAAVKYLADELGLDGRLFVPEHNRMLGAIGAAMRAESRISLREAVEKLEDFLSRPIEYPGCEPIKLGKSQVLWEVESGERRAESSESPSPQPSPARGEGASDLQPSPIEGEGAGSAQNSKLKTQNSFERAALGVDIGSVSTKAALVTVEDGKTIVLASYYRRTNGDPLAAVRDTLAKINEQIEEKGLAIGKISAATTGSGRYLTGDYIGADLVRNEITAQASGARAFSDEIDSIFEIGGQDSKYIRLDGDVIIDFEMNKACAAGTGAFLEKQAERLSIPLTEFGDVSLRNTRPPDLDWTCTVFSESAMVYYQQNNVPVEDLAAGVCVASVKNYLHKNVGSRDIGKKVAFQGAVAFNKGMVAAFETVLGRKIIVPPYPHITGAIGAARIAYLADPEECRFRGFDQIADAKYEITSFECKSCANRCDVNTFQMEGGPKYFYNDRCEKYSAVHKKNLGGHLPDLFAERERMMFEAYAKKAPAGARRVGVPRGLLFSEFFPLYNAFLTELGCEVVVSDQTNKRIVEMGLETAIGEPCFPFKVAHGHYMDLIAKGVDSIFAPAVLSTEQPNSNLRQAQTCPYLQGAPDVMASAVGVTERGIQHITPRLHFKRGRRHLNRVFTEVGRQLGKSPAQSRRALETGMRVLAEFRKRVDERGAQVLGELPEDQIVFIVVGRPYTLWDPVVNMDVGKKIQDLGILAIPQDFLPLEDADITDTWPNAYSRQIQKKLMAARLIKNDPRMRAVVVTYFACGPDSFGNPFFKDEIGEPCYVMQIDEHTADAGVITRIEAFADTARKELAKDTELIRSHDTAIGNLGGRRLWIPYMNESARVLAGCLRAYGIDAEALPRSPDVGLNLAREAISEDVCLPAFVTTEDMLYRVRQPDFDPKKEAFFQGNSEGPCRFGMYSMLQRRILDKLGYQDADIVTLGAKSEHGGLGMMFALLMWDSVVCHDLLFKMLLRARPYEANKGESEALFERYIRKLIDMIPAHKERIERHRLAAMLNTNHLDEHQELLRRAAEDFANLLGRSSELMRRSSESMRRSSESLGRDLQSRPSSRRPLVGVVGEFYVRLDALANQDILRKLEAEGAETWLAPMSEFFSYVCCLGRMLSRDRLRDGGWSREEIANYLTTSLNARMVVKDEHALYHATLPFLADYDDINAAEVIANGMNYMDYNFGGEAICSMGKSEDFANRGLAGIVSVIPFNCMPGNTVTALSQSLRRRHNNIPFLNLDYDGFIDSSRDAKIVNFMWQVKERHAGRKTSQLRSEEGLRAEVQG